MCSKRSFNKLTSTPALKTLLAEAESPEREFLLARSLELEPKMSWTQHKQKVCLEMLQDEGFF